MAAVIGRDFDAELLTEAAEVDSERVLDALETAEEGRLVEATPGRARFTFVHALVRSTLYDEIPTTRRCVCTAAWLRRSNRVPPATRTFSRVWLAITAKPAALGETEKAIRYATQAAEQATRTSRTRKRPTCTNARSRCSSRAATTSGRIGATCLIALANARSAAGDRDAAHGAAHEAAQHGREVDRPDLLADAAISMGGIRAVDRSGRRRRSVGRTVRGDPGCVAPGRFSGARHGRGPPRRRAVLPARGERAASGTDGRCGVDGASPRRSGDARLRARHAHWGMWAPGTARERLAIAEEILQLGRTAGDRGLELSGAQWAFGDLMELGDTDRADEMLAIELTIATELNRPDYLWHAGVHQCTRVLMDGRYDDAAQLADEVHAHGQAAHIETAFQMYGVEQFELTRARGGAEALEPLALAMVEQYPLLPAWRCGLAYLYSMLERPDDVEEQLEILAANGFDDLPTDANWMVGVAILTLACASVGDGERAGRLYDMLLPYRDYFVMSGMPALSTGSAELCLGARSRHDEPLGIGRRAFRPLRGMQRRLGQLRVVCAREVRVRRFCSHAEEIRSTHRASAACSASASPEPPRWG